MPFDFAATQARLAAFAKTSTAPRFVLFYGDWCPDCVRGCPPVRTALASAGAPLLEIDVGGRELWKASPPSHPLKLDTVLQVRGIPTLLQLNDDGTPGPRLDSALEDAATAAEVVKLVSEFVAAVRSAQ